MLTPKEMLWEMLLRLFFTPSELLRLLMRLLESPVTALVLPRRFFIPEGGVAPEGGVTVTALQLLRRLLVLVVEGGVAPREPEGGVTVTLCEPDGGVTTCEPDGGVTVTTGFE